MIGDLTIAPQSGNLNPSGKGLYSTNAFLKGEINADSGYLGSLDLKNDLSMQENSSIIMGDPTGGDSFHIGDFNILASTKDSTFLTGRISTSTSQSNSDAYSVSLDSDYNLSIDVDYDISSANNGTSLSNIDPNTRWELTIELRCIGSYGTQTVSETVSGGGSVGGFSGNVELSIIPPNGTTSIELYRSAVVTYGPEEGYWNSITVTSNDNEQAVWSASKDFIGKQGIRYSDLGNTQFKVDTSFDATSSYYNIRDRVQVRNGRLTLFDDAVNESISLDPRGYVIFHQAQSGHPSLNDISDAEGAIYALDKGGGNVNFGWIENSGATYDIF
jgi:hypothetical protein